MRILDRLLLAAHSPRARSRLTYRLLLDILMVEHTPSRAPARAVRSLPPPRGRDDRPR
jgi:hypothetical protein